MAELDISYQGKSYDNKDIYVFRSNDNSENIINYHLKIEESSNIDTKLFNYIVYNKSNGKHDILDLLVERKNFINNEMENSITENIDEMLRIKLLRRESNIEEMDNLELIKKANNIPDAHITEMYRNIKENLASNSVAPDVAQKEIRNFLNTFLNDENVSTRLSEILNVEKGVSQFNDLKRLSVDELTFALRQININEEDMERIVKSIVSSFA